MTLLVLNKGRKSQCICCRDVILLGDTELHEWHTKTLNFACHLPTRKLCFCTFSMNSQVFETNTYFINSSGRDRGVLCLGIISSRPPCTILTLSDRYTSLPACIDSVFSIYSLPAILPEPKPNMTISWHIWGSWQNHRFSQQCGWVSSTAFTVCL